MYAVVKYVMEAEDVSELRVVWQSCFDEKVELEGLQKGIAEGLFCYLLKDMITQCPVGFAVCSVQGNTVIINKIGILPIHQRLGLGYQLITELKGIFCKRNVEFMKLITWVNDNQGVHRFYEAAGFVSLYIDEKYYGGEPGIIYGIRLRGL